MFSVIPAIPEIDPNHLQVRSGPDESEFSEILDVDTGVPGYSRVTLRNRTDLALNNEFFRERICVITLCRQSAASPTLRNAAHIVALRGGTEFLHFWAYDNTGYRDIERNPRPKTITLGMFPYGFGHVYLLTVGSSKYAKRWLQGQNPPNGTYFSVGLRSHRATVYTAGLTNRGYPKALLQTDPTTELDRIVRWG